MNSITFAFKISANDIANDDDDGDGIITFLVVKFQMNVAKIYKETKIC